VQAGKPDAEKRWSVWS